jgi:GT2 family glycosyltransferase
MDLSIIIINWNSVDFLRKCLASVYAHTKGFGFEVLVVDNASFDGCDDMIREEFPSVRFIQSQENLGFARGNNLGFEHSTGEGLLFLNPDTEVVGAALEDMVVLLKALPDAGAMGPKLLNSDLSIQTSCLQSFPTTDHQVLDAEYLRQLFPRWSLWGNRTLFEGTRRPVPVEGISGACLLVKRSVFERVGGFTPDYFMYAEDMDLCYKIHKAGWKNYYVPCATVVHHGGQSTTARSDKQFSSVMMRESIKHFMRVHYGELYARLFQSATACIAFCRMCLLAMAMAFPWPPQQKQSLSLSFRKWRRVCRWAFGLETWAKAKHARP